MARLTLLRSIGAADLAADGDAEPHVLAGLVAVAGERVEDEVAIRVRASLAVGTIEIAAAREATPLATVASGLGHI